jgi:hypothetical protein
MEYFTYCLDISYLRKLYDDNFVSISSTYRIPITDKEILYDWMVMKAVKDMIGPNIQLPIFYRHEIYEMIYAEVGNEFSKYLLYQTNKTNVTLTDINGFISSIKLMVCGNILFISKGL